MEGPPCPPPLAGSRRDPARGPRDRAPLVAAARLAGIPVRGVYLDTPLAVCLARNDAREGRARVPVQGLLGTRARLVPPTTEEGFDRVDVVRPDA